MSPQHSILKDVFGYERFRGPQEAIVAHVVAGGDALVLMPTGGGKSLCYQVPAIVRQQQGRGVAIVVSPLIALMHDQVGALEEAGVHAAFLNSTLTSEEAARVEREIGESGTGYVNFQLAAALEEQVRARTTDLDDALKMLSVAGQTPAPASPV